MALRHRLAGLREPKADDSNRLSSPSAQQTCDLGLVCHSAGGLTPVGGWDVAAQGQDLFTSSPALRGRMDRCRVVRGGFRRRREHDLHVEEDRGKPPKAGR